jgi:hypothetical protein
MKVPDLRLNLNSKKFENEKIYMRISRDTVMTSEKKCFDNKKFAISKLFFFAQRTLQISRTVVINKKLFSFIFAVKVDAITLRALIKLSSLERRRKKITNSRCELGKRLRKKNELLRDVRL